jgi:4,4'-diaponeurosporenoate glycosyltransferase
MNFLLPYIILLFWITGFLLLWKIPTPKKKEIDFNSKTLSIIIPARNEAENLTRLLQSINKQTHRPGEVIVVNDQSQDDTVKVAQSFGCRVIDAEAPPEGWIGKPWACWTGAREAAGNILMFLDADTQLEPGGLKKIVGTYMDTRGLLSIQPFHRMKKRYERLSAVFNIIVMAGMNCFTPLGARLKPAGAFGPCNVCAKDDYFRIGGHRHASGDVLESLALGRHFIKSGLTVNCYGGRGSISFQMYPHGLGEMIEGHSKGFGTGAMAISPVLLVMLVCWVFGGVSLTRHLIESVIIGPSYLELVVWGGLDVLYVIQNYWILRRIGNFGFSTALFFQVPLLFFVLIFLYSLLKIFLLGRVNWKGRSVKTKNNR